MNYFWIRIFDYDPERDQREKGTLLDEFYLKDCTRDEAKSNVCERMENDTFLFSKPRKKPGMYAFIMESNSFFYNRFYVMIDTHCFWHECHKPIQGPARNFPRFSEDQEEFGKNTHYFCSPTCKHRFQNAISPLSEGEFQEKEAGEQGDVFGYIYLIYNRITNMYYIGQTRFLPFFRWQEHVKDGSKGSISDLVFSVLAEIRRSFKKTEEENQEYLNNIEAWWIHKFSDEGFQTMNLTKPKITLDYLKQQFEMIQIDSI